MSYSCYNFGVEIETVVRPYARRPTFNSSEWYKQLAERLENRGVAAAPDLNSRYCKHPEYYSGKWFITRDGSLHRAHSDFVSMEVVSPVLNTKKAITKTLSEFWEAMSVGFEVQKEKSCGGHVHVTPSNSTKKFSLAELQKIAFATAVYEDFVYSILPASRKTNRYCVMNSKSGGGLGRTCAAGLSTASLKSAGVALKATSTLRDLQSYMQNTRYVLWNFANICPQSANASCSGTLEFRGGSQFLNTPGTLRWIAFVVAFINLALEEDLLQSNDVTYTATDSASYQGQIDAWWKRIRQSARKLKMMRHLPEDWKKMQIDKI